MALQIDPTARVSALADIEDSTRGSVIAIGAHSHIDSFVKFKPAGGSGDVRIGARFPLAQAGDAHRALEGRGTTGKVLLLP